MTTDHTPPAGQAPSDFREVLQSQFAARCRKNPRYTLRSFARDLDVAPATLSEAMTGRHVPTSRTATKIAAALTLSDRQRQLFVAMVEAQHPRSPKKRSSARTRLGAGSPRTKERVVSLDVVRVISDWYHFGILELVQTKGFQRSPQWIGRTLGIKPSQAEAAIQRLLDLGFLADQKGKLVPTEANNTTPDDIPSSAIRQFHCQIMAKATDALEGQTVLEREIKSMIVGIPREALPELRDVLRNFFETFKDKTTLMEPKDEIYGFSMQFFRLQNPAKNAGSDDDI